MKAKKVYEFRTSGEIVSMGADVYNKKKVQEWLDKYLKGFIAEVNDNKLILNNNNNNYYTFYSLAISEFPPIFNIFESIIINGYLNLHSSTKLIKLPNNIIEVNGYLSLLSNFNLINLPDNLTKINGSLDLSFCSNLERLPENLSIDGNLDLEYCSNLERLPENLSIDGNLKLFNCQIDEIPKTLNITGIIYVNYEKLEYFKNKYYNYKFMESEE